MNQQEMAKYCQRLYKIMNQASIQKEQVTSAVVNDYYKDSAFFYRRFHSKQGAMHLPIAAQKGSSHEEKLRHQAQVVHQLLETNPYTNVLELGCGMGFNTIELAKQHPDCQFTGIDLTTSNIDYAKAQAKDLPQVTFQQGNFDKMEATAAAYDLIFAVETLCHSNDIIQLLKTISQLLKKGGRLVLFDGYVQQNATLKNETEQQAYRLLNWGFALEAFQPLASVLQVQEDGSLKLEHQINYSEQVLPNFLVFQEGAKRALRFPQLLKLLYRLRIVPLAFIQQLSAGLFGPVFLQNQYLGYYQLVFVKS